MGRAGLGRANSGPGQNRAGPKLARFFQAKILIAQPAQKTRPVGLNSLFKAKKNSSGPGHIGLGQIWPGFFWAKNLMAQPGPNFGRTGLAHRAGPILPSLILLHMASSLGMSIRRRKIRKRYLSVDFLISKIPYFTKEQSLIRKN